MIRRFVAITIVSLLFLSSTNVLALTPDNQLSQEKSEDIAEIEEQAEEGLIEFLGDIDWSFLCWILSGEESPEGRPICSDLCENICHGKYPDGGFKKNFCLGLCKKKCNREFDDLYRECITPVKRGLASGM